jgi:hypothetical protein
MDDFVTPIPERLPLSGGQSVDIKRRLNHGETEDMYARMAPLAGGPVHRRDVRTAKLLAYIVGWSLTQDGVPVAMSPELPEQTRLDTIRSLDPDRAAEMHRAIEAHEEAMDAAREAQKKIPHGAPAADRISASPSEPAGASPGSES